ncbi:Hypothetical predicted protein, partial [Paramuricea clavata]
MKVGDEYFNIEWFLGGDWKFLACVCGLGAAISTHPWIWCKCPLYDKYDGTKEWSMVDTNKEFRRLDAIDKKKTFNDGFERSKYTHMAGWESYLNDHLKIPFNWYVCKDSKKLKWRDLTGPEKVKLFRNVNICNLLPNHPKKDEISELWSKFWEITESLSAASSEINKEQFHQKSKSFLDLFLNLYQTKHVTPYMHAFTWHVPEFIELYGTISIFTQQGLEKLNDKTTKDFFRSTNQRGLESLKQLVLKRNRVEHLADIGCQREKRVVNCRNCNKA